MIFLWRRAKVKWYSVFHGFRQAKSANGGSILSSSQFLILPQPPQKMQLASKVVKVDPKIIISLHKIQIPETHCIFCYLQCFYILDQWFLTFFCSTGQNKIHEPGTIGRPLNPCSTILNVLSVLSILTSYFTRAYYF